MVSLDDAGARLRLDPFHAVTYARASTLPQVTSPPYDVIGRDGIAALEAADPHNVVRLILPRAGSTEDRYQHAAHDLRSWADAGVLVRDPEPALWAYRHETTSGSAVGLIGSIGLDGPVLPHETTFESPVADRTALMTATGAQLEPILLTYQGGGIASDLVDATLATPATIATVMDDGSRHDLWRIVDQSTLDRIAADLARRTALIADGHHRFAAYRRRHADDGTAATSTGLAVLVDASRHPLELRGVHRVVAGLTVHDAAAAALAAGFDVVEIRHDAGADTDGQHVGPTSEVPNDGTHHAGHPATAGGPAQGCIVLSDGLATFHVWATDAVGALLPAGRSARWRSLDASILKHALIGKAWGLDDTDRRVTFVHDAGNAVNLARRVSGVAALVSPPPLSDVMALAQAGETMPQKSTSFGPKPRTGLVMRWTHGDRPLGGGPGPHRGAGHRQV